MSKENAKDSDDKKSIKESMIDAFHSFKVTFPMILAVIMLVGLIQRAVPREIITTVFSGNPIKDTLIGSIAGSISAGNPITSYFISGELSEAGVSLYATTAFIVAWVTVGIIQMPAEIVLLGKKFAIVRNLISFLLAMMIAIITVLFIQGY